MKKNKNNKKKNSRQFNAQFKKRFFSQKTVPVVIFALVIVLLAGVGSAHLSKQEKEYEKQIDELSTEVANIQKENSALEEEKDNIDSAEFKERVARERLGMVGKDEYVLEQSDEVASTEETDTQSTKKSEEKTTEAKENEEKATQEKETEEKDKNH